MKVKLRANKLVDADIDMVSLVKHGANRIPFKITKSDDCDSDGDGSTPGKNKKKGSVKSAMKKMFALGDEHPKVVAVFVKTDKVEALLPSLTEAGFKLDDKSDADGVTIFKQDGYDDADVPSFIMLSADHGVAVSPVLKMDHYGVPAEVEKGENDPDKESALFFPAVAGALAALVESLKKADSMVKANIAAVEFTDHIAQLGEVLPFAILKNEFSQLHAQFGPSTFHSTSTDGDDMNKRADLSEVLKGDIDLPDPADKKKDEATATDAKVDAKAEDKVEKTTVEGGEQKTETKADDKKADGQVDLLKSITDAINAAVAPLNAKVEALASENAALKSKLDEATELAKSASDRASAPVVSHEANMDLALSSLGGSTRTPVRKGVVNLQKAEFSEDFWEGALPDLDIFAHNARR